ncbi:AAA family ATPase [Microcoleus sp. FACHB-53]|nr:AAA family ATPase [Microcoleus sp. FACHB-53]
MGKVAAIATRHWKSLFILNLLVLAATVGKLATSPKVWTATAQLILPQKSGNLDANLGTLGSLRNADPGFSSEVNPLKVQASILTSDALLERVLDSDPEKSKFSRLANYKRLFKASPQEQSTIVSLAVSGSTPELARQRTNTLLEVYQQRLNELRQADSASRKQFSQKELNQARERLSQAHIAVARFKQSTGLVNSEAQTQGIVSAINNLTTVQAQVLAQAQASENRIRVLSTRLSLTPNQAIRSLGLGENQNYQFVRSKLAEVDAQLLKLRATFTDNHPAVQKLVSERDGLQRKLQDYIAQSAAGTRVDTTVSTGTDGRATLIQQLVLAESEATGQQRQAEQLQREIAKLNAALKSLPASQAQLLELQRQVDVAEGVYKGLVAQVQQNNINAFDTYPNVQVLDPAKVDSKPSGPKRSITVLSGLMASLIGSIALVLFLESRNPLLSPKDLQSIKFPIVVRIPRLRNSGLSWQVGTETEVEFQRLASAISLQPLNDRRLLITSAIMGEGKTTVTLGLARALADLGFRVLLVDGDFRKAELSRRLGYGRERESADAVRLANEVQQPISVEPSLDLLPTLPKQGKIVELVRRGRFEQSLAVAESADNYDYVLVDSAPVSLTSETALMANVVPNVLFVVRPGTSYSNSVNESLDQLDQHRAKILGLVINGVEANSKAYPYRSNESLVNS